jgi:hypothetical protein
MFGIGMVLALGLIAWAQTAGPRTAEKFKARLSPVGIEAAKRAEITGSGTVAAVLAGTQLSITGSFDGMQSPATLVQVHQGVATGVRGPAIADLTLSHSPAGSITGAVSLTAEQVESLRKGKLYIQIDSEKAPDGNLWGWLLR